MSYGNPDENLQVDRAVPERSLSPVTWRFVLRDVKFRNSSHLECGFASCVPVQLPHQVHQRQDLLTWHPSGGIRTQD